jgi:hypothetical protein
MTNPLHYDNSVNYLPDNCVLKISPSKFSKFVNSKHNWYREEVLKEEGFTYSTASVLGTVVHYVAEVVGKKGNISKDSIYSYIDSFEENDDYCKETVLSNFESMSSVLVNQYILSNMDNFLEVESKVFAEIKDSYYAAGTLDILLGTKDDCMVGDYKTYNSKYPPKTIPRHYKYQLLVYAYILTKLGYTVSRVQLIYVNRHIDGGVSEKTGKPLKSYPPEVAVLTEVITEEDIAFITSLLELAVESCVSTIKYPNLTHVIWQDMRLKQ